MIINDIRREIIAVPETSLLDFLREGLSLTGTKRGCDIGVCGTCTVLVNGEPKRSCIVKISQLKDGAQITTIEGLCPEPVEGLKQNGRLHPIQQAFINAGAVQCGFCTPGMILTTKALLDKKPHPTREEIKKAFAANLCRCTGYQQIFEAVELASKAYLKL